jgi:hypothetical protein
MPCQRSLSEFGVRIPTDDVEKVHNPRVVAVLSTGDARLSWWAGNGLAPSTEEAIKPSSPRVIGTSNSKRFGVWRRHGICFRNWRQRFYCVCGGGVLR